MNCTGKRCIMQHDKVDPATCQCVSYCPQATPPKRNADLIRAMSDEELAEFLGENDSNFPIGDHKKEWLDWLKREVVDGV